MLTKNDIAIIKEILETNNKYLFSVLATKNDVRKEADRLDQKIDNVDKKIDIFKEETYTMIKDLQYDVEALVGYQESVNDLQDRVAVLESKSNI